MSTYIVDDGCINCKHKDCVEVCPVDCFYEGINTLVINPDECIDCGVCEPECPVEAIHSDTTEHGAKWVDFNWKYANEHGWPVITEKNKPPIDAKDWENIENKHELYFSKKPGK